MRAAEAFLAWLLVLQPAAASSPPTPAPVAISDLAPADEYFGPTHISILEIHHRIFALKDDLHHSRKSPGDVEHRAGTIADAFYDWDARFPRDPWLPRTGWELATLYEELPGEDARDRAVSMLRFVAGHFANSPFAADSRGDLARGVGVRPWPSLPPPPSAAPVLDAPVIDAPSLVAACVALQKRLHATPSPPGDAAQDASNLEADFRRLSHEGSDPAYARSAWELATLYEQLPGEASRRSAIGLLALLVDRYPTTVYGAWSIRDLERGIGLR